MGCAPRGGAIRRVKRPWRAERRRPERGRPGEFCPCLFRLGLAGLCGRRLCSLGLGVDLDGLRSSLLRRLLRFGGRTIYFGRGLFPVLLMRAFWAAGLFPNLMCALANAVLSVVRHLSLRGWVRSVGSRFHENISRNLSRRLECAFNADRKRSQRRAAPLSW